MDRDDGHADRGAKSLVFRGLERAAHPGQAPPPYDTGLRLGLAALLAACAALVTGLYDIGPDEPQVWLYGQPVARAMVALMLLTLALAAWALGITAAASGQPRALLGLLTVLTCSISFSVLDGATRLAGAVGLVARSLPSFRTDWDPVPSWLLTLILVVVLVTATTLAVPDRVVSGRPVLCGFVVSLPVLATLFTWIVLPHGSNRIPLGLGENFPADVTTRLEAPRASSVLSLFSSHAALALLGWLTILTLLSGAEFARGQVNLATRLSVLAPTRHRAVVAVVAAVIATMIVLGFAGLFGATGRGQVWYLGSPLQWGFCVLVAMVAGGFVLWELEHPVGRGNLAPMTTTGIIAFCLVPLTLLLGSILQLVLGPLHPYDWSNRALDLARHFERVEPLAAVALVGLLTVVLLRRQPFTSGSVFGAAFVVWATPSAVQIAVSGDRFSTEHLLASPQRLALAVSIGVLVVSIRTTRFGRLRLTLVKALVAAPLVAFGLDALLASLDQRIVLLLLVIVPVVWRFAVDTRGERKRLARDSVISVATWSAMIALAAFTVGAGSGLGYWDSSRRVEWNLLIVPLAFALLCVREPEDRRVGQGWGYRVERPTGSRRASLVGYAVAAAAGAVVVASAGLAFARLPDPVPDRPSLRADITLPGGWLGQQCPMAEGEAAAAVSQAKGIAITVAHTTPEALGSLQGDDCQIAQMSEMIPKLTCADLAAPAGSPPGLTWTSCGYEGETIWVEQGRAEARGVVQLVRLFSVVSDPLADPSATSVLASLTFE